MVNYVLLLSLLQLQQLIMISYSVCIYVWFSGKHISQSETAAQKMV